METRVRELAIKFKNGDESCFSALVDECKRRLYSAVYRMTRNHQTTDDMLQETFLKIYTSIDKYDEKYPFYPWLYRIAINTTLNHIKREKKRKKDSSLEEDRELRFRQFADKDKLFHPETALNRKERDLKIIEAMQKVSETYRAALVLRVFQGLSYNEIAQALDCSIGTVMSRLNRARSQLKELLADYYNKDTVK